MRRDLRRALCALIVLVAAALPATVAAAGPLVEIRAGAAACGAGAFCLGTPALEVTPGATVVWRNLAGVPLLISRCTTATCPGTGPGSGLDAGPQSSTVGAGAEFAQSFRRPGAYNYSLVSGGLAVLGGTVTVTAPAARAARAVGVADSAPAPAVAAAPPPSPSGPEMVAAVPMAPLSSPPAPPAAVGGPPAAAPAPRVATPATGAEPPWALGLLLAGAGAGLLAAGGRRRAHG